MKKQQLKELEEAAKKKELEDNKTKARYMQLKESEKVK